MPFEPVSALPAVPAEADLIYSRTIRAYTGQYVDIPFRGAGWVYLGEFGARRGVSYDSRRMEPEGMTFIFHADTVGAYSLKFNMQDFVRNYILNDYVRVIVEEPPIVSGSSWAQQQQRPDRVVASPRWPLATDPQGRLAPDLPAAADTPATPASAVPAPTATNPAAPTAAATPTAQTGQGAATTPTATAPTTPTTDAAVTPAANAPTTPTPTTAPSAAQPAAPATAQPATPAPATVEDFLKLARDEYNAGRIAGALRYLDQFMARYPAGSDEAFWLYGQSLEANNEATRDIRLALDYYRRLTNEYPQSSRYSEARRRIAYLERFYFNIQ
jgi:TolA-binding protein